MATLAGRVTDSASVVIKGVSVNAGWRSARTDRYGRYSISWLSTGKYKLSFTKSGYRRIDMAVTINPGVNTINVTMQLILGNLSGKVIGSDAPNGLAGVTVTLDTTVVTTDSSGNYGIQGIPPGQHSLKFEKAGYQTITM
jgi:hypothetical protein